MRLRFIESGDGVAPDGFGVLTGVAVRIEEKLASGVRANWLKKQGECWECPTTLPGFNLAPGSAPYRVETTCLTETVPPRMTGREPSHLVER